MAINAAVVWECRSTATAGNVNGGGFKFGASGTDWSQQDAAQYALTGMTSSGAGAIILTGSSSADMIGNIIHITSGTNFTVGWYLITAESAGVSITVDRNCTTGVGASGVGNIGGALSLGNSDDATALANAVAGNTIYIKKGTYTLGQAISGLTPGSAVSTIILQGYNSSRGDKPSIANMPVIDNGSSAAMSIREWWVISYLNITGTGAGVVTLSSNGNDVMYNCKIVNTSTTTARYAVSINAGALINCEVISYRGIGVYTALSSGIVLNCYIHDCANGYSIQNSVSGNIVNSIVADCYTAAIDNTSFPETAGPISIIGCTLYGAENKLGTGIINGSGGGQTIAIGNIIYGFATGYSNGAAQKGNYDDWNAYNNNTADTSNQTKGPNSIATAPAFTSVTQKTGTTGSVSGSVLTQSGADFSTVTDNTDFCYIKSGTGATVGKYLITAHTTTTLTLSSAIGGSGSNINWQVTLGHNFAIGTNYKGLGPPGAFPAALSTSYMDIGAVQRQEPAASSSYSRGRVVNR